jgi:type IV pilus assembly protein PilM
MGLNFTVRKNKRANIIIKDHVIRYLELSNQSEDIIVKRYKERFLPTGLIREGKIVDDITLTTILEECVHEWKIKKREVQFIVPDQLVVIRRISIPADLKREDIQEHLFLEIGSSIHLPFEDPVFEFSLLPLNEDEEEQDILLIAAPEEAIDQYRQILEMVHLKPVVADVSSLSIYRLYYELVTNRFNEHLLLIQFDLSSVNLTIFKDHKPIFSRHINNEFTRESWGSNMETLEWVGDAEDLESIIEENLIEIERVMNFYRFTLTKGKHQITKILLVGDHTYFQKITEKSKGRFSVPFVALKEDIILTEDGDTLPSSHYLPLGLALKEVKSIL